MKETVIIRSRSRVEMIDVTTEIQKVVDRSGIRDGICVIFVPHTTAALTINENADPDVRKDIVAHLSEMIPRRHSFRHAEGNSDAHIKAGLTGSSETLLVEEGKLDFGTWQSIFFCEFDGPRNRRCLVKVIGE
ncbi:MAG: YjbQ family protein [Deltaproteobacteria bacterium]|nr:YjbQ family protein [Deltaproteobacteria bacterium]